MVEVGDELGVVVEQPVSEGSGDAVEFGLEKEGLFHLGIRIKAADVNFNSTVFEDAAIGGDVGVVIAVPLLTPKDDQVHKARDGLPSSADIPLIDLSVDCVVHKLSSFLDDEIDLIEV